MTRARWYVVLCDDDRLQPVQAAMPLPGAALSFRTREHALAIAERLNEGIEARGVLRDFGPGAAEAGP